MKIKMKMRGEEGDGDGKRWEEMSWGEESNFVPCEVTRKKNRMRGERRGEETRDVDRHPGNKRKFEGKVKMR